MGHLQPAEDRAEALGMDKGMSGWPVGFEVVGFTCWSVCLLAMDVRQLQTKFIRK